MIEAKEKEYGKKLPSGDWKGAIGSVIRKESDVAAGHLIFNAERRKAVSAYTWPALPSSQLISQNGFSLYMQTKKLIFLQNCLLNIEDFQN